MPKGATAATLCATYNDLDSVRAIFEANKGQVAGIMLEPVVGNSGFIAPTQAFLEGLREMCTAEGAVLCFDEVMTGFRIARGCAQVRVGAEGAAGDAECLPALAFHASPPHSPVAPSGALRRDPRHLHHGQGGWRRPAGWRVWRPP